MTAWERYDLDAVMELFHEEILFKNWDGKTIRGKELLRKSWKLWFNRKDFRFIREDLIMDEQAQKVVFLWLLEWPSPEPGLKGQPEVRKGVDILYFREGKIIRKLTYTETTIQGSSENILLQAKK